MPDSRSVESNLKGWKSIASYFDRDERTVMRWASQRGLPIRRLPGAQRSSVYAVPSELAAWLAGEQSFDADAQTPMLNDAAEGAPRVAGAAGSTIQPLVEPAPRPLAHWRYGGAVLLLILVLVAGVGLWLRAPRAGRLGLSSADPISMRLYYQARYDLANRTPDSLRHAASGFGAAIAADPRNAAAYAALGETYLLLPEYSTASRAESYSRAESAANAAIALDPDIASAHRVRGFLAFWNDGDVTAARREFRESLQLAPDDPVTHHWYATALSANGDQDPAVAEIARARQLDPQSSAIMADSGLLLYLSGRQAEGLDILRHVIAARPDQLSAHNYLAGIALTHGNDATYLAEAATAARLRGDPVALAQVALARGGEAEGGRAAMLAALDRSLSTQANSNGKFYELARIVYLRGQTGRAISLLSQAAAHHDPDLITLYGDEVFRSLAHDPAVARLRPWRSMAP